MPIPNSYTSGTSDWYCGSNWWWNKLSNSC